MNPNNCYIVTEYRYFGLWSAMDSALRRAVPSGQKHALYGFYMNRINRLNHRASYDKRMKELEAFKCDAVHLSQGSAHDMKLSACVSGVLSVRHRNERDNHLMHKAAARVLLAYYKEQVNTNANA